MQVNNSFRFVKITALVLLWVLCAPQYGFSQVIAAEPVIKFAGMDTKVIKTRTYDQMLSAPVFECSEGYRVNRFSISFFNQEENNFYGPYTITGPRVKGEAIEVLQKLSNIKVTPLRISLDHIKITGPDTVVRNASSRFFDITD